MLGHGTTKIHKYATAIYFFMAPVPRTPTRGTRYYASPRAYLTPRSYRGSRRNFLQDLASIAATPILESIQPGSSAAYHLGLSNAGSSRSGGRFRRNNAYMKKSYRKRTRGKRGRKYKSKYSKKRKNIPSLYGMAIRGVTYTTETQNQVTGQQCVYLGHTTSNYQQFAKYFCFLLVKKCVEDRRLDINNWADTAQGFNVGDVLSVEYQQTPISAVSTQSHTLLAADILSYDALATSLWINVFFALVNAGSYTNRSILRYFVWTRSTDLRKFSLTNAKIYWRSFSDMKMQNRTVANVTDDDADDVDNVPLTGASYDAKGSTIYPKDITTWYPNDRVSGNTYFSSPETTFDDVPKSYAFMPVAGKPVTSKKLMIAAGAMISSKLSDVSSMDVNAFWKRMAEAYITASDDYNQVYFGKCRFFAFERCIGNIGAETQDIKVAFEVENKLSMSLSMYSNRFTSPIVENNA